MYKNFNLTDKERKEILEQHKSHGYKKGINEGLMDRLFGKPSVKDAASDSLRGQGFSHTGKEDEGGGDYIMFNGQKFYPDDIEYADNQDLGDIPRIEGDKLIIANPMWRE